MVKMAVFSAWAELQIASAEQTYLVDVLRPHIAKLTPLWLASLREYARLRFEPDISSSMGSASLSGSLDTIYAALNRETLLKVYFSISTLTAFLTYCSFIKTHGSTLLMLSLVSLTKIVNSYSTLSTAKPTCLRRHQMARLITSTIAMSQLLSSSCCLDSHLRH